jgi:hypothetical protein
MLFDVIGSAMEPFKESFGELFSALFDFVGQIGNLVMQVATILWDFYKFVYGPIFSVIGDVVGFVVENAKRMMDPGSVAQGIADSFTFNIFDFDKKNKKAAGGPVDAPSRAMGGPIGPMSVTQAPVLAAVGNTMLDAVVGGIGGFGFAGAKALGFISGDVARLRTTFGTTGGIGVSGSPRGAMKTAITLQKTSAANLAGSTDKGASEQLYRAVSDEDKGLKGVLLKAIRIFDANYGKGNATSGGGGGGGGGGGAPAGGGDGSGYSGDPGNVAVSGDVVTKGVEISKKIMSDTGATKQAAAAIAGNMAHESAGFVPGIREGGPFGRSSKPWPKGTVGKGYGWAQWTNHRPGSRYDAFIKSYGGDYNKIPTNADNYRFLMQELMQGNGGFISKGQGTSGSFAEFKKKTDVANATVDFRKTWERAGVAHDESRINYANKFLAKMASGGVINGKARPRRNAMVGLGEPTLNFYEKLEEKAQEKISIQGFAKGGVLSTNGRDSDLQLSSQTPFSKYRLHHGKPDSDSYNKNRLGGSPIVPRDYVIVRDFNNQSKDRGSPVVAGVDGKVVHAAGYTVVIKGSNGKDRMQFHHFDKITASVGQMVNASTVIGLQGNKPSGAVHVHLDATPTDHRAWSATQLGGQFDASSMTEKGGSTDTGGGGGGSGGGGGGGEAPEEPETVESMQKKLEDLLNQFGKAMSDTKKGFQLPAQEKPQTTAPSPTPAGSIQPATTVNAEQLKKAKEMEAKAIRDKESDMFVPAPTVIQQTIQQPVINNVGQSNTVVIRGTPSPMLTGRPRRTNH